MKNLILILFLSVTTICFAQTLPQLTRYSEEKFSVFDTLYKDSEGAQLQLNPPIVYYYNRTDSVIVAPVYFIPNFRNEKHRAEYFIGIVIYLQGNFMLTKNLELEIQTVICGSDTSVKIPITTTFVGSAYGDGVTAITFQIDDGINRRMDALCGTKEIELKSEGRIIIPKQNRLVTDYFEKADLFAEKTSLDIDFVNSSNLNVANKK